MPDRKIDSPSDQQEAVHGAARPALDWLGRWVRGFETVVVVILLIMIGLVTMFALGQLARTLWHEAFAGETLFIGWGALVELLGHTLSVLIALELLIVVYSTLAEGTIQVQVMFEVAIIAVTRKILLLDVQEDEPLHLMGVALLVVALAFGFWLVRRTRQRAEAGKG